MGGLWTCYWPLVYAFPYLSLHVYSWSDNKLDWVYRVKSGESFSNTMNVADSCQADIHILRLHACNENANDLLIFCYSRLIGQKVQAFASVLQLFYVSLVWLLPTASPELIPSAYFRFSSYATVRRHFCRLRFI